MRHALAPAAVALASLTALTLAGCAAPSDDDGEPVASGELAVAPALAADAVPVVVDTDLGADDLVALAYLLRHPGVDVRAVTVSMTGLVPHCVPAVDLVADLLIALDEPAVPVACGRAERGERGTPFPAGWRMAALTGGGLPRDGGFLPVDPAPAADLLAAHATAADGALQVVALGPLTNVAHLAAEDPAAYAQLAGVLVMGGVVDGSGQDGVGEWNAAADPDALDVVLAGPVPVTVVPADAVPTGTPDALRVPVVGHVVMESDVDQWWDLAAAAAFAEPSVADAPCEPGRWVQDDVEPGRLTRADDAGSVCVVRALDPDALAASYAEVFRVDAAPTATAAG